MENKNKDQKEQKMSKEELSKLDILKQWASIEASAWASIEASAWASVSDSVWTYVSTFVNVN
jgi:hypothetical protein